MSGRNFGLTIDMRKLVHVEMVKNGQDGKPVKGMFIPYANNQMVEGKEYEGYKPMEMRTSIHLRDEAKSNGQIGFQKQKLPKKWSEQTDNDKEIDNALPYLGNLFEFGGETPSSGAASSKVFDADSEADLPF